MNPNFHVIVIGGYAVVNIATFALYAIDKRAAKLNSRRVRERTLQLWTFGGGFLGALAGQALLRHKTRHPILVAGAWLALVLHAAGWVWWMTGGRN